VNKSYTKAERAHLERVKSLPCSVCDFRGPSEAHHIDQSKPYTCVALCAECHRGSRMGWHGEKAAWHIHKMDELSALNVTIKRLMEQA
jgi:hypothetical protein